jgi:hypothetical protein
MARHPRWALAAAFAVLTPLGILFQTAPAVADSSPSGAAQFVADINGVRAAHGLRALQVSSSLASTAYNWSVHLASVGTLSHNPSLAADMPTGWQKGGENVGVGADVTSLEAAFVNSPEHYVNMVDPGFNQVGVAVDVDANGYLWATEDYVEVPAVAATAVAPRELSAVAPTAAAAVVAPRAPAPTTRPANVTPPLPAPAANVTPAVAGYTDTAPAGHAASSPTALSTRPAIQAPVQARGAPSPRTPRTTGHATVVRDTPPAPLALRFLLPLILVPILALRVLMRRRTLMTYPASPGDLAI